MAIPISSGVEGALNCLPARIILTFRIQAERSTLASASLAKRQSRMRLVARAQSFKE